MNGFSISVNQISIKIRWNRAVARIGLFFTHKKTNFLLNLSHSIWPFFIKMIQFFSSQFKWFFPINLLFSLFISSFVISILFKIKTYSSIYIFFILDWKKQNWSRSFLPFGQKIPKLTTFFFMRVQINSLKFQWVKSQKVLTKDKREEKFWRGLEKKGQKREKNGKFKDFSSLLINNKRLKKEFFGINYVKKIWIPSMLW